MLHLDTGEHLSRRLFIKTLATDMIKCLITKRSSIGTLSIPLRQKIKKISGINPPDTRKRTADAKTKCDICPAKKNRYTTNRCDSCARLLCKEHVHCTKYKCHQCSNEEMEVE